MRSEAEIPRAEAALQLADLPYEQLQPTAIRLGSKATLSTMHLAKGMEFRAVIVMACDEDVIPNAERIKAITDDSDLHPRPRSPADHQHRTSSRSRRPHPRSPSRCSRSVEWGGGRFQSAPTEADERN